MKQTSFLSIVILAACTTACHKEPKPADQPNNESELITTVRLLFTDSASGDTSSFQFRDPDGEGGNPPVTFDTLKLDASHSYLVDIILLDESKSPVDTVSNEVKEEANDHLFVFNIGGAKLNVSILDKDGNNLPLGLHTRWRTGTVSEGTAEVLLRHQPGIKDGTPAPGESDVDVTFHAIIK